MLYISAYILIIIHRHHLQTRHQYNYLWAKIAHLKLARPRWFDLTAKTTRMTQDHNIKYNWLPCIVCNTFTFSGTSSTTIETERLEGSDGALYTYVKR